jgi:hypothetical protein
MVKVKGLLDFKKTDYYDYYTKVIDDYSISIIEQVMSNNNNDIKYSWNDVLKLVYKFINSELRDFKDNVEINPEINKLEQKTEQEYLEQQAKEMLGMN